MTKKAPQVKREHPRPLDLDWLVCYLRWAALVIALAIVLLDPHQTERTDLTAFLALFLSGVLYSLLVTILLSVHFFPAGFAAGAALIDTLLVAFLLYITGGAASPLLLLCLFPTLTATVRFDTPTGFLIAVALISVYEILALPGLTSLAEAFPYVLNGLLVLLAPLFSGVISDRAKRVLVEEAVAPMREELHRLRRASERAKATYEMASTLSATLNYQRVLDAVLDISTIGFEELAPLAAKPVGIVFLFGEDHLYVAASRNLSKGDPQRIVEGKAGLLGQVLTSVEPVIGGNLGDDPELSQFAALRRCRSCICVPLRAGFEIYGAVLFASPDPDAYTEEHADLVVTVCNQAVVALQNAQLYQSLREEKERIINQEEEARKKLARDLHDGPTQTIAAIAMRLNFVKLLLEKDPKRVRDELDKLEKMARRTTKEIRTMLFTLRPVVLETQGLQAALEQLVQKFKETEDLPIHLEVSHLDEGLDINIQAVAFYIIEEALNNARKHAQARNIWVRVEQRDDVFIAEIEDDGKGFDLRTIERTYDRQGSLGLINLRERAELVEGTLTIDTAPGKGTRITLVVPLSKEETSS